MSDSEFHVATSSLYDFFLNEFCDVYLEYAKLYISGEVLRVRVLRVVCGLQSTDDEASLLAPAQAGADQERAEHVSRELLPPPPSVHALRVRGALAALAHQPRPRGSYFYLSFF
jgi:hypothetical protein